MAQTRFEYLFERCISESATNEEQQELIHLLQQPEQEAAARGLIQQTLQSDRSHRLSGESSDAILQAIFLSDKAVRQPVPIVPIQAGNSRRTWLPYAAAAILFLAVAGVWLWKAYMPAQLAQQTSKNQLSDIPPGGDKAVLTLADGTVIVLDSTNNGALIHQGTTAITKKKDGQLVYDASRAVAMPEGALSFNKISTPRGGQYQVILPDGSKVWLNAASSLHFPTAFPRAERRVSLIGEAYFEINKNETSPFYVLTENQEVAVLGTSFNIMGYADEETIKTTLLEGSVKVRDFMSSNMQLLQPGQQSKLDYLKGGRIRVEKEADIEEAMAWKNGKFQFQSADLQTIMRQVSRWYDIDVVYEGAVPSEKFTGEIPRNSNMMEVFKILKLSNVHFKIEGRTLTVMP
jgi:ferric-dicitrate binding protein FerR (iron transport regulator)